MRACVRACVHASVRTCVRACDCRGRNVDVCYWETNKGKDGREYGSRRAGRRNTNTGQSSRECVSSTHLIKCLCSHIIQAHGESHIDTRKTHVLVLLTPAAICHPSELQRCISNERTNERTNERRLMTSARMC